MHRTISYMLFEGARMDFELLSDVQCNILSVPRKVGDYVGLRGLREVPLC